jgi:hypothetical protein
MANAASSSSGRQGSLFSSACAAKRKRCKSKTVQKQNDAKAKRCKSKTMRKQNDVKVNRHQSKTMQK